MFSWLLPSVFSLSNAIRVPSGDQAGGSSVTLFELVMFCGVAAGFVRSRMKMSKFAPVVGPSEYAILVRSGDQVGCRFCPVPVAVVISEALPAPTLPNVGRR